MDTGVLISGGTGNPLVTILTILISPGRYGDCTIIVLIFKNIGISSSSYSYELGFSAGMIFL